jgi:hypothetical protein
MTFGDHPMNKCCPRCGATNAISAADRRDAARYRWLRATGGPVAPHAGEDLDAYVDQGIDADLAKVPGAIDPRNGNPVPARGRSE